MLTFPAIDPVAFAIGPLVVRWYALSYLAGFIGGWRYALHLARMYPQGPTPQHYDDYLSWAVIGTVLGGRIGYVLFYNFAEYAAHPLEALQVWHGGMSFHGGMLGVILAAIIYTRKIKVPFFAFSDVLACCAPIGLGLGRIANFVNGELYGRASDASWAMIFPRGGDMPRHPSQLYESALEGFVLFTILAIMARFHAVRVRHGLISGAFLIGYALFRSFCEFFREPDAQLGFLYAGATMGQLLCIPMFLYGVYLVVRAMRRGAQTA